MPKTNKNGWVEHSPEIREGEGQDNGPWMDRRFKAAADGMDPGPWGMWGTEALEDIQEELLQLRQDAAEQSEALRQASATIMRLSEQLDEAEGRL